jgi:hypothetical protein
MKIITMLLNLPDAWQWLKNRQEVFPALSPGFANSPKTLTPVMLYARIN